MPKPLDLLLDTELSQLYRTHLADIRQTIGFTLRRSPCSASDLDDLVQGSFLRFIVAVRQGQVDEGRNVAGYLATIARNVARDWLRWRRRDNAVEAKGKGFAKSEVRSRTQEPEIRALQGCMARLSTDLVALFVLRFQRGLSQAQTAGELKISRQQVRTLEARLLRETRLALAHLPREGPQGTGR